MGKEGIRLKCSCGWEVEKTAESGFLESIGHKTVDSLKCPQCKKELIPEGF